LLQITDNVALIIRGTAMSQVTLEEATALADQWKAQREDQERAPNAGYFRDATPHDAIRMWKTGKGISGKKLSERESSVAWWKDGSRFSAIYRCKNWSSLPWNFYFFLPFPGHLRRSSGVMYSPPNRA
jgi:hypothetical protein